MPKKDLSARKKRFSERPKLLTVREDAQRVAEEISFNLGPENSEALREIVERYHPADLADTMFFLTPEEDILLFEQLSAVEAAEVIDEVDDTTRSLLAKSLPPERLALIITELPTDEAADIVALLDPTQADQVLGFTEGEMAVEVRKLLAYPRETAGALMSTGFVDIPENATQEEALARFRDMKDAEHIFYVYAVGPKGELRGAIDLRALLTAAPSTPVKRLMDKNVITVEPSCDQEQVARIFARYDLGVLPVVESPPNSRLLGIITSDDVIDVMQAEYQEDVAKMTGSDAHELEKKTPYQIARLRLPWLMATMFIELFAGFVIHAFNQTLTTLILLASFMPIISAISGNTGLQSAAIIIRGLSTGHVQVANWKHAVTRQLETTMMLGGACALVLGVIGAVWTGGGWEHRSLFGLTVTLGMFASVNIAGVVGTIIPLLSKRLGYDPALTAGPFETAFQDVVGISIFLALATALLPWIK